jgi:hypothetical protein
MSDAITVAIIAAVPSTLAAVAAAFLSFRTHEKVQDVKVEVDGRFTELLALTRKSGEAQGAKEERDRADAAAIARGPAG